MPENPPQNPPVPAWENIALDEIKEDIAAGRMSEALFKARLRLEGIQNAPKEIDDAISEASDVSVEAWQVEQRQLIAEIENLQTLIDEIENSKQ